MSVAPFVGLQDSKHKVEYLIVLVMHRKLLARLCILREEIAEVVAEEEERFGIDEHSYVDDPALNKKGMNKEAVIFLRELLILSDKDKR